jgi:transposase
MGRSGDDVGRYSQEFKDPAVARLLPPESAAITTVSQEHGVSVATLERWRAEALSRPAQRAQQHESRRQVA